MRTLDEHLRNSQSMGGKLDHQHGPELKVEVWAACRAVLAKLDVPGAHGDGWTQGQMQTRASRLKKCIMGVHGTPIFLLDYSP